MSRPVSAAPFKIASLKRRRVCESVADQIRQAIFDGRIEPGHKLPPEREMARQFQTSRVALREALRALEQEGMINIKRGFGGGAFVADFDGALRALTESLNTVVKLGQAKSGHLTEVRTILEPEMTRLATLRASEEDLAAMEAVVQAQEQELRSGELTRKRDMEFHRLVASASKNPVLTIVVGAIDDSIRDPILRSKLTYDMRARVVGYHRSVFEAIRKRDAEEAYRIMKEHVVAVQNHLRESEEQAESKQKRPRQRGASSVEG
ncbi:MAG TPA: FadR/GntR family transcriptional regulator [Bryobacteraceae bacterium]|nr:FadR/GntR family transcriptional regulator [Bryobacteraceae bacterium]